MITGSSTVEQLVSALPEIYQPIYRHPDLSARTSRNCLDRLGPIRTVYERLATKLGRPLRVLDIGCAQGFFPLHLAETGAEVLGIDKLEANIQLCTALRDENSVKSVTFRTIAIEEFLSEIRPGEFDLFLGLSVFHHLCHASGVVKTRALLDSLRDLIPVGVLELASASEPLPWADSLPENELSLLSNYSFVHVLDRLPTHLSVIKRSLILASSQYWILGDRCGRIEKAAMEPHRFARGTHLGSRRYFHGEGLLVKQFSFQGERGELNRHELVSEARFLTEPAAGFAPVPQLLGWRADPGEGWLVREELPGQLLPELQDARRNYDVSLVVRSILTQLVALEQAGLYHDDVRVWNTLVLPDGRATLIDYGAISVSAIDCSSSGHPVRSFLAYIGEVASGATKENELLRFPYSTPSGLRRHLGAWIDRIWAKPQDEWTFQLFLDAFLAPAGGTTAPGFETQVAYLESFVALLESRLDRVAAVLEEAEAQRATREQLLRSLEADLTTRTEQVAELTKLLRQQEAESIDQIRQLTALAQAHEAESTNRAEQINELTNLVRRHETESADRAGQIDRLIALAKEHEGIAIDRAVQVDQLTAMLKASQAEASARMDQIHALTKLAHDLETESTLRAGQIETLNRLAREYQGVIQTQATEICSLQNAVKVAQHDQHQQKETMRQAQTEASLAARMLGEVASLPASSPTRWMRLPTLKLEEVLGPPVRSNLEVVEFATHIVRISGWGFAAAAKAAPAEPPLLLFSAPNALWLLRGTTTERPDVAATFPTEGNLPARLRSGFLFEFHPGQLPAPAVNGLRIVCGKVGDEPVLTPPFSLP